MKRRRPLVALAPLLVLALAACGTTLDDKDFTLQSGRGSAVAADGQAAPGGDGSGAETGTTLDAGPVDESTTDEAGGTAAGSTSGAGSVPGVTGGPSDAGRAAKPAPLKPAPRAVDQALAPVEIGILYYPDANSRAAALGNDVDFGDPRRQAQATLDHINANGGFGGHKGIPVFDAIQQTDTASYTTLEQQVCDDWTQDHHVIAGIVVGNIPPFIQQCMNERKTVIYAQGAWLHDTVDYKTWPFMVNVTELLADQQQTQLVESLVRRGFFKPGDKVGVFYDDYAANKRVYEKALVPALKKHGIEVFDSFAGHFPESTGELPAAAASLQTPTLKFKSEGINKVLFAGTGEMLVVLQYAEANDYHPTYGFTTNEVPTTKESASNAHSQLPGSMGIGWSPNIDITVDPPADNDAGKLCLKLMEPISGATTPASRASAFHYCGSLLFLAAGANQNPQTTFDGDALRTGLGRLGGSYTSPLSIGASTTPSHRAGVSSFRDFAYDTGCFCIRYTSGPITVG